MHYAANRDTSLGHLQRLLGQVALVANEQRTGYGHCGRSRGNQEGQFVGAGPVEDYAAEIGPQPSSQHVDGRDESGDEADVGHAIQSADKGRDREGP
jgi:hypothetical protein